MLRGWWHPMFGYWLAVWMIIGEFQIHGLQVKVGYSKQNCPQLNRVLPEQKQDHLIQIEIVKMRSKSDCAKTRLLKTKSCFWKWNLISENEISFSFSEMGGLETLWHMIHVWRSKNLKSCSTTMKFQVYYLQETAMTIVLYIHVRTAATINVIQQCWQHSRTTILLGSIK